MPNHISIPVKRVGPLRINSPFITGEVSVPLATYETPLWPSVGRGAKISRACGGIDVVMLRQGMTRSIVLEAPSASEAKYVCQEVQAKQATLKEVVEATSRFATFEQFHFELVGKLIYIRLSFTTGDASGHNMVTKAADAALTWMLEYYPSLRYVSISANYCVDKKVSAINGILGRGKHMIAEITIPESVCRQMLHTTPKAMVELHIKKNLIGSVLAGSIRSANAHIANILLAFYLALGQDAANIVEGSQGIVHAEVVQEDLYFSVTLPNIIVGTVGNGKGLECVKDYLKELGCAKETDEPGDNASRLAAIIAATVLCGELSLLAAQTNPGELMRSHEMLERRLQTKV